MYDKATIFNLALNALRLNYQTQDTENDSNPAVRVLRLMWVPAWNSALEDMDLNRTATKQVLELTTYTDPYWKFVYKYPANCAKFRRICSNTPIDNFETEIPAATMTVQGVACIFTNQCNAMAEIIPNDIPFASITPNAGLAIAYRLAFMCSSLIVGKGAEALKKDIFEQYKEFKAEAQESDLNENLDYTPDEFNSEFVFARTGGTRWPTRN